MTQMSEPQFDRDARARRNWPSSHVRSLLARPLHDVPRLIRLALTMMSVGCVIPPSLSVQTDAGVDSPPSITSVRSDNQELPEPGPVLFTP